MEFCLFLNCGLPHPRNYVSPRIDFSSVPTRDFDLFSVSRSRAVIRAGWRALCAGLLAALAALIASRIDWRLMWRTDAFSCAALACVVASLALPAAGLALSALRWLLLALWPGPLGITWSDSSVDLALGPFGRARLDTARLRFLDVPEGFVALCDLDDRLPRVLHPDHTDNLMDRILIFTGMDASALRRRLVDARRIPCEDGEMPQPVLTPETRAALKALAARHRGPRA